jgi:hypothetical protein
VVYFYVIVEAVVPRLTNAKLSNSDSTLTSTKWQITPDLYMRGTPPSFFFSISQVRTLEHIGRVADTTLWISLDERSLHGLVR